MKEIIKHIKADKIIRWGISISGILLCVEIGYILLFFFSLPPYIPLYNQMPWGESRLGTRMEIFLPVVITLAFFILNFALLTGLYEKLPLVSRMLSITTLLITLLSVIFVVRTLLLIL